MRSTLITESGIIGTDGKLRLPMERINQFGMEHAGERVLVKIEAMERHSSVAAFRYYFGYVIPTVRIALTDLGYRMTEKETHEFLWNEYPGEHNPDIDIRESPASQVSEYLGWLKQYAAENFHVFIEDPARI